ncbi:MAG: class I SAM-dependent methyltransferase [Patescibacteria group bacterium]
MSKLVKDFYTQSVRKEWLRLIRSPYRRLEFETTLNFLKKHLPDRELVLDAGGGPGRYTIELAKMGYEMVLLDYTPRLLEFAKRQTRKAKVENRVKQIIEGSISDLSMFKDNQFDGVICLGGTLSHILDKTEREKAIAELVRVAKQDAPVFVSVIGRFAILINELVNFPEEIVPLLERMRDKGEYRGGYGFAPCYFFMPEELKKLMENQGTKTLEMVGLEGLASHHPRKLNRLAKTNLEAYKIWLETHAETCTHPAVVAMSEHFMIISRKSG